MPLDWCVGDNEVVWAIHLVRQQLGHTGRSRYALSYSTRGDIIEPHASIFSLMNRPSGQTEVCSILRPHAPTSAFSINLPIHTKPSTSRESRCQQVEIEVSGRYWRNQRRSRVRTGQCFALQLQLRTHRARRTGHSRF